MWEIDELIALSVLAPWAALLVAGWLWLLIKH